jgi:predicted dehydrogenase
VSTSSSDVSLGIGQVGLGGITVPQREGYRLYSQPVVAGFDPDPVARARFAADTPEATVYESLEQLLDDPRVGVIDLATPHHRQSRQPAVDRIAASGKPVLIQKPLAMTYSESVDIAEALERHAVVGMVNQNMCFVPAALDLERTLLVDRVVGEPTYAQVQMQYLFDTADHPWFGRDHRWWTVGLTVHHLGLLQLLFGPPVTVFAMTGHDRSQPGVDHDGYGHICLSYLGGLDVVIVSTGTYYGTEQIPHGSEAIWVQGPSGLVDWSPSGTLTLSRRADGSMPLVWRWLTSAMRCRRKLNRCAPWRTTCT